MIELEKARWRLAIIWFPASAGLIIVLVLQSLGGAYGDDLQRVWGWALPNLLPTIALMMSVFAAEALKPAAVGGVFVQRNFSLLSIWLSGFYLALLLLPILSPPLVSYLGDGTTPVDRIQMLENSNLWLGPLQGLVVMALGVLFFQKQEGSTDVDEENEHGVG